MQSFGALKQYACKARRCQGQAGWAMADLLLGILGNVGDIHKGCHIGHLGHGGHGCQHNRRLATCTPNTLAGQI